MPYIAKKGLPFVYKGAVDVTECKSSAEVMEKACLDWEVAKCEVYSKFPVEEDVMKQQSIYQDHHFMAHDENLAPALYAKIPNGYATYRKDYGIPLGIVKERYTPVQNNEAFSFFDDAIGKNAAIWQTAGYFGMGERIFVSAKLPNTITVKGDPVDSYLVFTNSHDGSSGVKILFTPIRIVCLNTLNAAIRKADILNIFSKAKINLVLCSHVLHISAFWLPRLHIHSLFISVLGVLPPDCVKRSTFIKRMTPDMYSLNLCLPELACQRIHTQVPRRKTVQDEAPECI